MIFPPRRLASDSIIHTPLSQFSCPKNKFYLLSYKLWWVIIITKIIATWTEKFFTLVTRAENKPKRKLNASIDKLTAPLSFLKYRISALCWFFTIWYTKLVRRRVLTGMQVDALGRDSCSVLQTEITDFPHVHPRKFNYRNSWLQVVAQQ